MAPTPSLLRTSRLLSLSPFFILWTVLGMAMVVLTVARPGSYCDIDKQDIRHFRRVLNEDFTEPALNRSIWNVIVTDDPYNYDNDRCGNALCQAGNVIVHDGELILRSRSEPRHSPTDPTKLYQHTSAAITTQDKFDIYPNRDSITRVCIRAKLPIGQNITKDDGVVVDTASGLGPLIQLTASNSRRLDVTPTTAAEMNVHDYYHLTRIDPIPDPPTYFSCNPDEGQITILRHQRSDQFTTSSFSWQENVPEAICKFPAGNRNVILTTPVTLPPSPTPTPTPTASSLSSPQEDEDGFHEWAVERSGTYITYIFDGVPVVTFATDPTAAHKSIPTPPVPEAIAINATSPFYLSLSTIFGSEVTGDVIDEYIPVDGWELKIDYVRVSHYDPHEPHPEKERRFQYILFGSLIAAGLAFLVVVVLCACCRKKNEYQFQRGSKKLSGEFSEAMPTNRHPLLSAN